MRYNDDDKNAVDTRPWLKKDLRKDITELALPSLAELC